MPVSQKREPPRWLGMRFCGAFLLLVVAFSWFTASRSLGILLHDDLTRMITILVAPILALFGNVSASGHVVSFNGFGASIEGACDGVQPTYIYVAAVLAFPSRWRDKVWGIGIGIPSIFLINVVRITTVVVCGAYSPQLFEQVHLYGWQALVIALTLAVWLFWAEHFVRRRGPSPA